MDLWRLWRPLEDFSRTTRHFPITGADVLNRFALFLKPYLEHPPGGVVFLGTAWNPWKKMQFWQNVK